MAAESFDQHLKETMNALVKNEQAALTTLSEDELLNVLEVSLYPGASRNSIKMVLGYCKAAGLDPMQKPVHIVPMWDNKAKQMRDVIMPGVGLYRTQASRTERFAGQTEPEFGPMVTQKLGGFEITYPEWARVTVKKQMINGTVAEFTACEYWLENYAVKGGGDKSIAPNAMWAKRPRGQIAKCAAAQALRLAFPEMGAQPTAEEMEGKTFDSEVESRPTPPAEIVLQLLPEYTADKFAELLPAWRAAIAAKKATPDQIIAKASTKGTLTDAQKQAITEPQKKAADVTDATPKVTYAVVAEAIQKAENQGSLDAAAALIQDVADETQRDELAAMANKRFDELPPY